MKRIKIGLFLKKKRLSAIVGITIIIASVIVIIVMSGNKHNEDYGVSNSVPENYETTPDSYDSSTSDTEGDETMSDTALSYSFDEIVVNEPKQYKSIGRISFVSEEANYYGEITVGSRSYVENSDEEFEGTYSLFVSDSGSSSITVKSVIIGYYRTNVIRGSVVGDEVEYPEDADWSWGNLTRCEDGFEEVENIRGLSIVRSKLGANDTFASEMNTLLACVITEDEAVRYVQDGTLPDCLQGLTVSGLDSIFNKQNADNVEGIVESQPDQMENDDEIEDTDQIVDEAENDNDYSGEEVNTESELEQGTEIDNGNEENNIEDVESTEEPDDLQKSITIENGYFGHYNQNAGTDGYSNDPIHWEVINETESEITLMATYCLDAEPYNEGGLDRTWKDCTLREWLNNSFYDTAFTEEEKSVIKTVSLDNGEQEGTEDKVYLLSKTEFENINDDLKIAWCTAYAKNRGCFEKDYGNYASYWWLRSRWNTSAYYVAANGTTSAFNLGDKHRGVRPVVTIDLTKANYIE